MSQFVFALIVLAAMVLSNVASYRWGYDQGHCDAQSDIADDCDIC